MTHRTDRLPRPDGLVPAAVVVSRGAGGVGGSGTWEDAVHGPRAGDDAGPLTGDVGRFRRGDPFTRDLLARYLVARTVGDGIVRALLLVALAVIALTLVLAGVHAPVVVTVLVGLVALAWVVAWRLVRALWVRLAGAAVWEPVRPELDRLVRATRPAVRRELREAGLPAHPLAGLVVAVRLLGRRRAATAAALRRVDLVRVVPPGRVDELDLLLERARTAPPAGR